MRSILSGVFPYCACCELMGGSLTALRRTKLFGSSWNLKRLACPASCPRFQGPVALKAAFVLASGATSPIAARAAVTESAALRGRDRRTGDLKSI